jgi:hypothetical protein
MHVFVLLVCAIFAEGCLREAPNTQTVEWDESCRATESGHACLTLHFFVSEFVRDEAPGDLVAVLHWAIYRGGDVGLLGPGDSPVLYDGETDTEIDLSGLDASYDVHVPNVPPGEYQVLGYFDDDGKDEDSSGDPVTFPSDPFVAKADLRSRVDVPFDYLR